MNILKFLLFSLIISIVYGLISHSPVLCGVFLFAIAKATRQERTLI